MMCEVYDILDRGSFRLRDFDSHTSFILGPMQSVLSDIVLKEPGWTLFAYDIKKSHAVFLDNGAGVDLSKVPFCYNAQFEQAKRLALVPFPEFLVLADKIADPRNVVQLFNIGHCGSTLLHHVFNRAPHVWCISEPVFCLNLAMERDSIDVQTMHLLMRAGMRFLTLFHGAADADTVVVKHFSQMTTMFRDVHEVVPEAKSLFLYRDGRSWPNSIYHFIQKVGSEMIIPPEHRAFHWAMMSGNTSQSELDGVVDLQADVLTMDVLAAAAWALHMRQYLSAIGHGVPMMAVRYNELNGDRLKTIARIFEFVGIAPELASTTLDAFDADSHQNTRTARNKSELNFTGENYTRVAAVYANPRIAVDPNMILPDSAV